MGRELRRKQAKREGKSLRNEETLESPSFKKGIITLLVVVVFGGLIYLMSALFVTKELNWFNKSTNTIIKSSNVILAVEAFDQKEEEYYVYFYDFKEEDTDITSLVTNSITTGLYKVDTSSALNSNYVSEESNKNAKNIQELKVKEHTLIKVSGDTIVEYYEEEEIKSKYN